VAAELSAQLVTRYTEHQMYDELKRQVKQLRDELSDGRKAIDNVISFASLVGKNQKLYFREADIAQVIQEAVKPLEEMAKTRKIRLSFKLDPKLPPVELDKERINEAVYHLVYNAIKYNHAGGMVEVACFPAKEKIIFKVEDTGVGLPSDQLATIWEAFAQNSDDLKRGVEGLGLGLALVKLVIDAHGGTVAATSTPGQGSIFGFQIPVHQPQESEPVIA
jgi:signal transduction histidine kinase